MKCGEVFPDEYHLVPNFDFREHSVSCDCWCKPRMIVDSMDEYEDEEEYVTFIHNPIDRREEGWVVQ